MASSLEKSSVLTRSNVSNSSYESLDDAFQNLDKKSLKALAYRLASYYRPINRY